MYRDSVHEQVVARGILSVALDARRADIDGMQVMSRSAAIFSGDLVLTARDPHGSVSIMLADFTGHGLSAAIGVLPVAEMFSVMTEKGFSPEVILRNINDKLFTLLPKGMFMAACVVQINSGSRSACVLNCGMPDVYLLDRRAKHIKRRVRSTHIPLGISNEADARVEFEEFDVEPDDVFILHSDGLTEACNCHGNMFGSERLDQIIELHNDDIFDAIQVGFSSFTRDRELSDDVTLVTIPCGNHLARTGVKSDLPRSHPPGVDQAGWRFMIEVSGAGLREIDPVSIIMQQYSKLDNSAATRNRLDCVLTVLYNNALNHGVLEASHFVDGSLDNEDKYDRARNRLFDRAPYGFVRTELQQIVYRGHPSLLIRLEDSGRGFDHASLMSELHDEDRHGANRAESGIALVRRLCESLHYRGKGNRVEAIIADPDREASTRG